MKARLNLTGRKIVEANSRLKELCEQICSSRKFIVRFYEQVVVYMAVVYDILGQRELMGNPAEDRLDAYGKKFGFCPVISGVLESFSLMYSS